MIVHIVESKSPPADRLSALSNLRNFKMAAAKNTFSEITPEILILGPINVLKLNIKVGIADNLVP